MSLFIRVRDNLYDRNLLEVSRRSGVSYSVLRKIIRGEKNISLNSLLKIAIYLGVKQ